MLKENNIISYICNNCNLKIKPNKELIVMFHNAKSYDNAYMIDTFSKIKNITINVLPQTQEKFKMITFRIPEKKYSIKIIDSLSFLQGNLEDLSKDLDDRLKFVTKNNFNDKFPLMIRKLENFPYMYVNPDTLYECSLPKKVHFHNILTVKK